MIENIHTFTPLHLAIKSKDWNLKQPRILNVFINTVSLLFIESGLGFQVSYDKSVLKNYSCWGLYINLVFFMRSCLLRHSGKWCVSNSLTIKHLSSKGRGSHQERNLSSLKHSLLAVLPFMNWINCLLKIIF